MLIKKTAIHHDLGHTSCTISIKHWLMKIRLFYFIFACSFLFTFVVVRRNLDKDKNIVKEILRSFRRQNENFLFCGMKKNGNILCVIYLRILFPSWKICFPCPVLKTVWYDDILELFSREWYSFRVWYPVETHESDQKQTIRLGFKPFFSIIGWVSTKHSITWKYCWRNAGGDGERENERRDK